MNTQDSQGNGLIGGGIGAVLGGGLVAAKYDLPEEVIGGMAAKDLWGIGKTMAEVENIDLVAYAKKYEVYKNIGKAMPAINMLYRLGAPITAALLGSTLTD